MTLPNVDPAFAIRTKVESVEDVRQTLQKLQQILDYIADALGSGTPSSPADLRVSIADLEGGIVGRKLVFDDTQFANSVDGSGFYAISMATNGISAAEIAANAVGSSELADNAVDTNAIQDDAVTYAKIQNVSATDRFLGRDTAGAGVVEEITATAARTILNVEDGADVTDATNVASAGAVMDSDISPGEGFLRKTGAGAYTAHKSNLSAAAAPGATDDGAAGYSVGSIWIDTTADKSYICVDSTTSAAVWNDLSSSGGNAFTTIDCPSGTDPVADSTTDTLQLLDGNAIEITGDSAADSVTIDARSQVFVTSVTGSGTISNKTYEANTVPSNKILTSFESDNDDITLTVQIHIVNDSWQPDWVKASGGGATEVTVNKQNWTELVSNGRVFTASINLTDADTTGTITVTMSDGATTTVSYTRSLDPPLILTAVWDNQGTNADPYPAIQTQFKNNDNMQLSGTAESHANEVYIKDFEATSGQGLQGPYTVTAGSWTATNVKAGNATNATARYKVYAKVTGGTAGADFTTTATTDHDQTVPAFTGGAQSDISYPGTQEALGNLESCSVGVTHTNIAAGDTYLYDDNSRGEVTIPNTTTYQDPKLNVSATAGLKYNEDVVNYRLTVTRTQKNGASATQNVIIKIASITPTLTVTPTSRFGTDDGTNAYKDHTITLTSSQANLSTYTPTMSTHASDTSDWVPASSWAASGDLAYTRSLRVKDADINAGGQAANNFSWTGISVKNRAGVEATTITTNPNYSIGGFDTRTLNMGPITGGDPPYTHTADIGTPVVDTSKTTVVNTSKGGSPSQTYEGNVTEHNDSDSSLNNFWTTVNALAGESFDDFTQYFHCSDKKFYDSVTAPGGFNVTIAESA